MLPSVTTSARTRRARTAPMAALLLMTPTRSLSALGIGRREFVSSAGGMLGVLAAGLGCSAFTAPHASGDAHLTARPGATPLPSAAPPFGKQPLGLGVSRDGVLYVP